MSIFDGIQGTMMNTIHGVFGDSASWIPSYVDPPLQPGQDPPVHPSLEADVLFREPTNDLELAGIQYQHNTFILEYFMGSFPDLKPRVDMGKTEIITYKNNDYFVKAVTAKFDGKTFLAVLQLKGPHT